MPARPHYRCLFCDAGLTTAQDHDATPTRYGFRCPSVSCDVDFVPFDDARSGGVRV
jgi:hypothetical protein